MNKVIIFLETYGNHPALYKISREGKDLIVYYIYDSYRTPALAWRELLSTAGRISVRGTPDDGIFLGLLVDAGHKYEIRRGRFDGIFIFLKLFFKLGFPFIIKLQCHNFQLLVVTTVALKWHLINNFFLGFVFKLYFNF